MSDPNPVRGHKAEVGHGTVYVECSTCGYHYPQNSVLLRNGVVQCTIAGVKEKPCLDKEGFREVVQTDPYELEIDPD